MTQMVDFHTHILPGIDDGSTAVEESLRMLRLEAEQGIFHVVATPHFYATRDNMERFLESRNRSESVLREVMDKQTNLPTLTVGAEVRFFSGISRAKEISALTIGDSDYVLIEMPHPPWTAEMYCELDQIHNRQGLIPIIAHVDRYISRFRTFDIPQQLANLPVMVQANAEFFLNRRTTSMALRLLKHGKIHLLGSDCHNLRSRKPNLGEAVELITKRLGASAITPITHNASIVLSGGGRHVSHTLL